MTNLEILEQYHEISEILDVIKDIEQLDYLVWPADWESVNQHMQRISNKYLLESSAYNAIRMPASSLKEKADSSESIC